MAFLPSSTSFTPGTEVAFNLFTSGNNNVPGASQLYQAFLVSGIYAAPAGVLQIGPFAFDYKATDSVSMQNDVTDHWIEDNTAVQDHIGVKPITVTLKGSVSELVLTPASQGLILNALATVENTLSQADAYLGKYTAGATQTLLKVITQAQNVAIQVEQAAARAAQIASFFFPGVQLTRQQQAFTTLYALRMARTVFTIYTPFMVFYNMVIVDIDATQPDKTRTVSDFSVTMKQLMFASTLSQSSFLNQYGGNAAYAYQPQTSNGLTTGVQSTLSTITSVF